MGMDMTLYHEADKDIWVDEELNSSRCPYFRNERDLHSLFERHAKKTEDGNYEFTKADLSSVIFELLPSIMNIYAAAMDAHREMAYAEEAEYTTDVLHREFYVIGRMLDKVILKEYRNDDSAPYLLTEDTDGSRMKKLVNDLVGLVNRMKDDEKVIYNCSY